MDLKPDFNRFLAAVNHRETDRVPLGEILIDYSVQSKFLGRTVTVDDLAGQVEFWAKAGYDFIPITVSMMSPGKVTEESKITRVLKEMVLREKPGTTDPKAWNLEMTSFIHERPDIAKFPWEAAADIDFSKLHAVKKLLPPGMKVIAISGKIFTLTWMLMGFNNFALKLALDESFVAEVFERVATIQFKALETIFAMDHVAGVWVVDDIAFGTGPMISPAALKKHVFSWYKKVGERCHEKNRIFLMHSDGDLSTLMDDLIAMDLDVIQPIDPSCMDMAKVKKAVGRPNLSDRQRVQRAIAQRHPPRDRSAGQGAAAGRSTRRRVCPGVGQLGPELGQIRKLPGDAGSLPEARRLPDQTQS